MNGRASVFRWVVLGVLLCAVIVVPFVIWEDALALLSRNWLEAPTSRAVVAFVAAALLAVDLALPIPSSFVSAGAVAAVGPVIGAVAIWAGMTLGALAGYALGAGGGTPIVEGFVGRSELERAERLMARFGVAMLVVCRGVPVLAEASVLVAGAARMRLWTFSWVTSAANLGLAVAYAMLSRVGWGGPAVVVTPFVLGIAIPAAAIFAARRLERQTK
jgi:uncharacterized membrane protein YdjX (TVP38/TMEM64 family)